MLLTSCARRLNPERRPLMGEKKEKLDGRIVMDAHEAIRWVTDRLYVLKNILDETDRSHYSTAMEIGGGPV